MLIGRSCGHKLSQHRDSSGSISRSRTSATARGEAPRVCANSQALLAFPVSPAAERGQASKRLQAPSSTSLLRLSAREPFQALQQTLPGNRRVSLRDRERAEKADATRRTLALARQSPVPGQFLSPPLASRAAA